MADVKNAIEEFQKLVQAKQDIEARAQKAKQRLSARWSRLNKKLENIEPGKYLINGRIFEIRHRTYEGKPSVLDHGVLVQEYSDD